MNDLWRTLKGHRTPFVMIAGLNAVVGGVEAMLHPLLLKAIFDQAILAGNFSRFVTLGAYYLLLGLTLNFGSYRISCWRKRFENALVLSLEMELLDRTLGMDGRRLSQAGSASYVSRVHNDVQQGVLPGIEVSIKVSRQAISSVVFIGVLLYLSWQASLILLVVVPPLVIVSNRIAKQIHGNTDREREAEAQYINTLTRTLEAFRAIRGLSLLVPGTRTINRDRLRGYLDITFVNYRHGLRQRTLSDLVMNLSDTASLVAGAYFVFAGSMSFGGYLAFVNSLWRAVTGVVNVVNTIPEFGRNAAVLQRIHTLRSSEAPAYHDPGPAVRVHGARVAFDNGATVSIDDFELRAGERILLRGPNGCGKTTLLNIISGTLAPDAVKIMLPPRVASLTSPVHLPPLPVGTLIADERLRRSMGVDHLIEQLPTDLSSGQRQKVGVAALLSEDADVYILDEPFANLDEDGKKVVLRLLEERTRGRGVLVVHHGDEDLNDRFDRVVSWSRAGTPSVAVMVPWVGGEQSRLPL